MKHLVLSLSLALSLTACSGKEEASKMKKITDELCACKTVECAEKVYAEIEKFTGANEGKKVSAEAADAYNADITRAEKCAERIVKDLEKAEK
jgi:hypothetical protein